MTCSRTYDAEVVYAAIEQVKDDLKGLPPGVWLYDRNNIAVMNDSHDVSLFEYRQPGVYTGHYFFHSRGRDAVVAGKEMLSYVFSETPIRVIIGMTPIDKKGATWMTRQLGFEYLGDEDIDGRVHSIFIMTKKDYEE